MLPASPRMNGNYEFQYPDDQMRIGFGDSDNDLQMTDVVGISVCMANGSASLKQRCDRIAPSVYEDGISKEFAALGLI